MGLYSGTKGAIDAAIKTLDVEYSRPPKTEPVTSLTTQIKDGGRSLTALADGAQGLSIKHLHENIYACEQQIGTHTKPCKIQYQVKIHRPFKDDFIVQQWSVNYGRDEKRWITPVVSCVTGFSKKTTNTGGRFAYDLNWRKVGDGILVAYFLGDNVDEQLILPGWLVKQFYRLDDLRAAIDESAKRMLNELGINTNRGRIKRLVQFAEENPENIRASNWVHNYHVAWEQINRLARRIVAIRDNIFRTVAYRLSQSHDEVVHDGIEIAKLSKHAKRSVSDESLPKDIRRRRVIAAPGLLREYLENTDLKHHTVACNHTSNICPECSHSNQHASDDRDKIRTCENCGHEWDRDRGSCLEAFNRADMLVPDAMQHRDTNIFTGYIEDLHRKSGTKRNRDTGRSDFYQQYRRKSK